ncbi:phage P2 GpU superfamily [Roseibium sp. TrichSKD4]|uniref:phage tail protein n=1 Tax=Roseibium sp. TrichSKD4 TaxID=744980 RepID=UPI0001E575AE|nr:phage tail protein [Roseibium sp. TrichSKD4]EFO30921.1 phage P2 GpU superfamily [Roseibium sp. TrichSKD4]
MSRPLAALGMFLFAPSIGSYEELEHTWNFKWAKPDPIGSPPVKQWMGKGDEELSIIGGVWPEIQPSGTWKIDRLAKVAGLGVPLVFLSGSGTVFGLWCVEQIHKRDTLIEEWGIPGAIEYEIYLSKYTGGIGGWPF